MIPLTAHLLRLHHYFDGYLALVALLSICHCWRSGIADGLALITICHT
jgi:hypothetical protein